MKLFDIVTAYAAAESLMRERCSYGTAAALVQLRAELRPLAEFYLKEERALMLEYAEQDETGHVVYTGPNSFSFRDPKEAGDYQAKRERLMETDMDVTFQTRRCPAPAEITPSALVALSPFLEFQEVV